MPTQCQGQYGCKKFKSSVLGLYFVRVFSALCPHLPSPSQYYLNVALHRLAASKRLNWLFLFSKSKNEKHLQWNIACKIEVLWLLSLTYILFFFVRLLIIIQHFQNQRFLKYCIVLDILTAQCYRKALCTLIIPMNYYYVLKVITLNLPPLFVATPITQSL